MITQRESETKEMSEREALEQIAHLTIHVKVDSVNFSNFVDNLLKTIDSVEGERL